MNLPHSVVALRRMVNPKGLWSSTAIPEATDVLLLLLSKVRFKGRRCKGFFLLGGRAAAFELQGKVCVPVSVLFLGSKVLLLCVAAMAAFITDEVAKMEAWWAGGGQMGSWIERTALAAEMEPTVERCWVEAGWPAWPLSFSSWWLLLVSCCSLMAKVELWKSRRPRRPVLELEADFLARKQRGMICNSKVLMYQWATSGKRSVGRSRVQSADMTFTCCSCSSLYVVAPPTPTQSFRLVKLSKINGRTPTLSFSSLLLPPASSPLIKERSMRDLGKTLGFSTLLTLHQKVGRSKGVNYYSNIPNRHFLLVVGVVSFKILLRLLQIFQIQIFLWTIFNVNWHLIWSYL